MASAYEIAEERLAKGEISEEEFDRIVSKLSSAKNFMESMPKVDETKPNKLVEIEDGVMNIDGCEAVKTDIELITQINAGTGLLFVVLGFFMPNQKLLFIGAVMLVIGFGSLFVTRSVKVKIMKEGKWQKLGKFTYQKAEELKAQISASMQKS